MPKLFMDLDPLHPLAALRTKVVLRPMMRNDTTPVDQTPPATIAEDRIPVVTLSLHEVEYFYNIPKADLADLIDRNLLPAQGQPYDPSTCFVDLESAARTYAICVRGRRRRKGETAIADQIRTPDTDSFEQRIVLARFLRGHAWGRAHQRGIVGLRPCRPEYFGNKLKQTGSGWQDLKSYCDG